VLGNGRILVSWTTGSGNQRDVHHQVFATDGSALSEDVISSATIVGDQFETSTAALGGGRWVATWTSNPGGEADIVQCMFGPDGVPLGQEHRVNESVAGSQFGARVTALIDGSYVVVWTQRVEHFTGFSTGKATH